MKKVVCLALCLMFFAGISFAENAVKAVSFNGDISLTITKDGKPMEVKVSLKPGENLTNKEVMDQLSDGKTSVTWKDMAALEADMMTRDKFSKLMADNLWAKRINSVIELVEAKYGVVPDLGSVLSSLGIPKDRPTGGEYSYIPGPDNNPSKASRVTYRDVNLNTFLDPSGKIADVDAGINIPEATDASRSQ